MAFSTSPSPFLPAMEPAPLSPIVAPQSAPRKYNGLFLVHSTSSKQNAPKQNTQAIADSIVADIERDMARADRKRTQRVAPVRFKAQLETPLVVARRLVKNLFGLTRTA